MQSLKVTKSPFTTGEAVELGNYVLEQVKVRIHQAIQADGNPAPPLKPVVMQKKKGGLANLLPYAEAKARLGLQPIRDLMFSGNLMNSVQVVSANQEEVVIGSNNIVKDRILGYQNRLSRMFALSDAEREMVVDRVAEMLGRHIIITPVNEE